MSGTAFRGVSSASDSRFPDKDKKLMKSMNFPKEYATKVDLKKVNWEVMKTWIAGRVTELLGGVEDDVLIGFVFGQFEGQSTVDPRQVQISLTGFLEKNTSLFMKELWLLLASAAENQSGIPQKLLDDQAAKIAQKKEMQEKINERLERERKNRQIEREEEHRREEKRRYEAQREREKARANKIKEEEERYQRKRAAERDERERRYEEQRKADRARDEQRRAEREKERKRRDRSEERLPDRTAKGNSSPVPVGKNGSKLSRKEEDESIAEDPGSPKVKKAKKEKKEKKEKRDKREKKEKKEKKSKKEKKDQNEESGSGSEQSQGQKLSLEDELRQKALLSIKKE